MTKPMRLAIVGAGGNGAKLMADAVPLATDAVQLVAACDVDAARLGPRCEQWNCRGFRDVTTMLSTMGGEIDLVHVATPSGMHLSPVEVALRADKHVVCDKPLEITIERMQAAIRYARNSTGRLFVISQNRWLPGVQLIYRSLLRKRLGGLYRATVISPWDRNDDYYRNSWRGKWAGDGGAAMINQTIHAVDLATWLCAAALQRPREETVVAVSGVILRVGHLPDVLEADDVSHMHVQLCNAAALEVVAMTCAKPERKWTIELVGAKGEVKFDASGRILTWRFDDQDPDDETARQYCGDTDEGVGGAKDPLAVGSAMHAEMLKALAEAIRNKAPFELDALSGGAYAGLLIRQFYGNAHDPMGLRPLNFVA